MRIVLVEWRPDNNLFKDSLGIQYIASVLRKQGYEVKILIYETTNISNVVEEIVQYKPDITGIQFYSTNPTESFYIAENIKKILPNSKIVLGGHAVTLFSESIFNEREYIDYIVLGEGELTFLELCNKIQNGERLNNCKGIVYKKDGFIVKTEKREQIRNLENLPFPVLDLHNNKDNDSILANIQTSRGCMGKCAFCVENRINDSEISMWRGRSAKHIVSEMCYIREAFPEKPLAFSIIDSSFEDPDPVNKNRVYEFAEELQKKDIKCGFSIFTRAESWTQKDKPLINLLRKSGLYKVQIGFESGSDKILSIFNKRACVDDNIRTAKLFREAGVEVFGFLIMFHPYVELDDLRANASFLQDVKMGFYPEMWFHKIDLHEDARIFNKIKNDGLLLDKDESGYYYNYTFIDKNTEKVSKTMTKFSMMEGPINMQNLSVKIDNEIILYNVWKDTYSKFKVIESDMQTYQKKIKDVYEDMEKKNYDFFVSLIDDVEFNDANNHEKIIARWNKYLVNKSKEIETFWMKNCIHNARKRVKII